MPYFLIVFGTQLLNQRGIIEMVIEHLKHHYSVIKLLGAD